MDAPFPETMMDDIVKMFAHDVHNKPGKDLYDHVFDIPTFMPLQRKKELVQMMLTARELKPQVVMEIGADKGGGLYHWCKCLNPGRVVACEIRGVPYSHAFQNSFPGTDFLWLAESSYAPAIVKQVEAWLAWDKFDCIFIDGDKANFMADFLAYAPMVRSGGIVFMHDIQDESPGNAFREASEHELVESSFTIINTEEGQEAKEREAQGLPSTGCYEDWLRIWGGRSCGVGVMKIK